MGRFPKLEFTGTLEIAFIVVSLAMIASAILLLPQKADALSRTFISAYTSSQFHGTGGFSTGSFTPPNNSLLVAVIGVMETNGTNDPSGDITITDSAGLTWTSRALVGNASSFSIGFRIFFRAGYYRHIDDDHG